MFISFDVQDLDVHVFHVTFDLFVGMGATWVVAVPETGVATGLAAPDSLPASGSRSLCASSSSDT